MLVWMLTLQYAMAEVPKTIPLPHIRGKELYEDLCFQCHGTAGLADNELAKTMNVSPLAGKFDGEYAQAIALVQEGKGLMPAYEMVIDKHDTKRILIYLGGLDPETGVDPRIQEEVDKSEDSSNDENPENLEKVEKVENTESKEGTKQSKPVRTPNTPSSKSTEAAREAKDVSGTTSGTKDRK